MRLSADENFPGAAVTALRDAGHDVFWVRTETPGAKDTDVLAQAFAEGRVLVTFDKDFGDLAFRSRLPATCGILLFRLPTRSPEVVAARVVTAVESCADWSGQFAVVTEDRIRVRPLPKTIPLPQGDSR